MEKTKSVIIVLLVILVIALGGILIYSNVNSNNDNDVNINNENNNNNESVNNNEQNAVTQTVETFASQLSSINYETQTVNYSVTAEGKTHTDWKIYYANSEYVFLIASRPVKTTSLSSANGDVALANSSEIYGIMKLGQTGYTLNDSNSNSKAVATLVNGYGAYANTEEEGYKDASGNSYVVGAIGGPTMELLNARSGGEVTLGTNTYGYIFTGVVANTGLPVSSMIWLTSPSGVGNDGYDVKLAGESMGYGSYSGNNGVCPVVCLKSTIPATLNGTTWMIGNESVNNNEQNNTNNYGDIEQLSPTVYNVPLREYENKINTIGIEKYAYWLVGADDAFEDMRLTKEEKETFNAIPFEWAYFIFNHKVFWGPGDAVVTGEGYNYIATSDLREKEKIYEANNLAIDRLNECWSEGVEGFGIGEKINVQYVNIGEGWEFGIIDEKNRINEICEEMYERYDLAHKESYHEISEICIENGYCMSEELWNKNARVKTLKVTFDDKKSYILNLEDTMQLQKFDIEYKNDTLRKPINVTFEILEVYEGTTYDDTCITTIKVAGWGEGISTAR